MIHVFTSSAPNYIGKVRALFESLREHCGEMVTHWLIADVRKAHSLEGLCVDSIDDVLFVDDFDTFDDRGWLFRHNIVELCTAIKPEVALRLLSRSDCDLLLYFDPDMVLFSPLDDLLEKLRRASLVLTPHLLKPEREHDAVLDHELCSLRHGVFNLGFFGVRKSSEGEAFLKWWHERCREFCWGDWREGVFTDQKWCNFVPAFFPDSAILRSPRFNVAPWNINQRRLVGTFDEGFKVDGDPLGFYHFTGFDSGAHEQVIQKYAAGNQAVSSLVQWYAQRTCYLTPEDLMPWSLGRYENGQEITASHRVIYRQRLDLQSVFPDPFLTSGDDLTFLRWVTQTGPLEYADLLNAESSVDE